MTLPHPAEALDFDLFASDAMGACIYPFADPGKTSVHYRTATVDQFISVKIRSLLLNELEHINDPSHKLAA